MNKNLFSRAKNIFLAFDIVEKAIFFAVLAIAYVAFVIVVAKINDHFTIQGPARGGSYTEGIIGYPRFINPLLSYTDADKDMTALLYAGLLKADLSPELAESYSVSADGLSYTFKLKPNLIFHDGAPLTTEDVAFTISTAVNSDIMSPRAENWKGVTVEVLSPLEIKFTLQKPYPSFIENMTMGILPKHIWKNIQSDAFDISAFNREPIGSGPYQIQKAVRDNTGIYKQYTLKAFDKYALGKPYIKNINILFFKNETDAIQAYDDGDIQALGGLTSDTAYKIQSEIDASEFHKVGLPRIFSVFLNQSVAPVFTSREVRQALNNAVDRDEIISKVFHGFASPADGPLPDSITRQVGTDGNNTNKGDTAGDDANSIQNFDNTARIQSARDILVKAGWKPNANGIMTKQRKVGGKSENQTLSFTISTSNNEQLKATAEILKDTWQKIGAEVKIEIYEPADLNQKIIKTRKYDALLYGNVVSRDYNLFPFWHSSERNDPGLNIAGYANIKVDKMLETAREISDTKDRMGAFKKAEDIIISENPAIFLYSPDYIYLLSSKIKNANLDSINQTYERWRGIEKWYINIKRIWKINTTNTN